MVNCFFQKRLGMVEHRQTELNVHTMFMNIQPPSTGSGVFTVHMFMNIQPPSTGSGVFTVHMFMNIQPPSTGSGVFTVLWPFSSWEVCGENPAVRRACCWSGQSLPTLNRNSRCPAIPSTDYLPDEALAADSFVQRLQEAPPMNTSRQQEFQVGQGVQSAQENRMTSSWEIYEDLAVDS